MPLVDWNLQSAWDNWSLFNAQPEGITPADRAEGQTKPLFVGYTKKKVYEGLCVPRAKALIAEFGYTSLSNIFLVGASYGWTLEALHAEGLDPLRVIGADTSQYIIDTKDLTEEAEIDTAITAVGLNPNTGKGALKKAELFDNKPKRQVNAGADVRQWDITKNSDRVQARNYFDGSFDVITESMLESFTDAECQAISDAIWQLGNKVNRVIHIVQLVGQVDPTFNSKTLAEWKALLPNDIFMQDGTWRTL